MPLGGFINELPPVVFLVVHLTAFLAAAYFAKRSFDAGASTFGWAFSLYGLAELIYMTYHLDWTVVLFAHTIAEVLNLAAFALIFVAGIQRVRSDLRTRAQGVL